MDWVKSFLEGVLTLTSLDVLSVEVERADFRGPNDVDVISNALTCTMDAVLSIHRSRRTMRLMKSVVLYKTLSSNYSIT